jgi:hypothetical protein
VAFTDKGTVGGGLSIAFATETTVRAVFVPSAQNPGNQLVINFTTDLADGVEGTIAVQLGSTPQNYPQGVRWQWPANVRWPLGLFPNPNHQPPTLIPQTGNFGPNPTVIIKLLRDNAAGAYYGRVVSDGSR